MDVAIHPSWKEVLADEFEKPYFKKLTSFVKKEYQDYTCFPPGNLIFSAFNHSSFANTKIVLIGQDPYHGPNQANGLCFSVNEGMPFPPSLSNIFKELKTDLDMPIPQSGNLTRWADQGVLMLNATLTVRAHQAGSHQGKGWEKFTDKVITELSNQREGLIFMLWGGKAKKKSKLIDSSKHFILESGHPSPLSANRGYWFGNKHFSQANELLKKQGANPILW
jgi:uracil-DNA glycosylase